MLTADDFTAMTGSTVPDNYQELLLLAEEILHTRTLQQYRRPNIPQAPREIFRRALAMQVLYMATRGGIDAWADPSSMASWVSIGRFSVNNLSRGSRGQSDGMTAPAAEALIPTLMAYAHTWIGGDVP